MIGTATLVVAVCSLIISGNVAREAAGLPRLRADSRLMAVAQQRAENMAARTCYGRGCPPEPLVSDLAVAAGYDGTVAENTSIEGGPREAVAAWLAYPVKAAILLDPAWRDTGEGVAYGDICRPCRVQVYGRPTWRAWMPSVAR